MGGDLRDVFDKHPAKKVDSPLKLDEMVFNSEVSLGVWGSARGKWSRHNLHPR